MQVQIGAAVAEVPVALTKLSRRLTKITLTKRKTTVLKQRLASLVVLQGVSLIEEVQEALIVHSWKRCSTMQNLTTILTGEARALRQMLTTAKKNL